MTHPYIQIPVPVKACAGTRTDPNMRTGMSITSNGNLRILVPTYTYDEWSANGTCKNILEHVSRELVMIRRITQKLGHTVEINVAKTAQPNILSILLLGSLSSRKIKI